MRRSLLCVILVISGYTHVFAFISQGNWRWRNNDGTEKTATWKAGQDTAIIISDYKAMRLRISVDNAQTSNKAYNGGLESATSVNGPWTPLSDTSTVNPFNLAGDNTFIADND